MPGEIDTRKYLGIPFRHNGRGMDGVDCLGLMLMVLRDAGIDLPDDDGRPIDPRWYDIDPERLIRGLGRYGQRINITEIQPLDVVVFSFHGKPRHAGVMIDRSRFIHIREHDCVSVARLRRYSRFFYAAYRMAGEKE